MDLDEVCFEKSETEDYIFEDLVNPPDPITKHLIEYHVKVLLKGDIVICPGEEVLAESACIIRKGVVDGISANRYVDNLVLESSPSRLW